MSRVLIVTISKITLLYARWVTMLDDLSKSQLTLSKYTMEKNKEERVPNHSNTH